MTLDRLQSKPGLFQISPDVSYSTTGTASTVGSNQWPGGLAIGSFAGFAGALTSSSGGGAPFWDYVPHATTTGSFGQAMTTGGTISHYNAGVVGLNVTVTANNLQLVPPYFAGQALTLYNCGTKSCSVDTIGTVNNWSTTGTVTAQVLQAAFTLNSGSAAVLQCNPFAATTTNQWPTGLWAKVV